MIYYLIFLNRMLLVKNISLTALHRICSPISTFAPVKSFIYVSVKTADRVYNCETAAFSIFIFIISFIVSWVSKNLNVLICLKS
jgi:hypothetical protein